MLWATPNTWYSRYPDTALDFLSSSALYQLNDSSKGFGIVRNFLLDFKDNLEKELNLLEQDGKF